MRTILFNDRAFSLRGESLAFTGYPDEKTISASVAGEGRDYFMHSKRRFVLCMMGVAVLGTGLYIVLHEAGHCLVALACGAKITEFSVLGARMAYAGGSFNRMTGSLLQAAGLLLPIMTVFLLLCFYRRDRGSVLYHISYFVISLSSVSAALAWILIPAISLFAAPPAGDDVTKFMEISGLSPYVVMLGAVCIILLMLWFMTKRGLLAAFRRILRERSMWEKR